MVGIQQEEIDNLRSTNDNQRHEIERLNYLLRKRKYESYSSVSQYGYESNDYQYDRDEESEFVPRKRMKMSHDDDDYCRNNRQGTAGYESEDYEHDQYDQRDDYDRCRNNRGW